MPPVLYDLYRPEIVGILIRVMPTGPNSIDGTILGFSTIGSNWGFTA